MERLCNNDSLNIDKNVCSHQLECLHAFVMQHILPEPSIDHVSGCTGDAG